MLDKRGTRKRVSNRPEHADVGGRLKKQKERITDSSSSQDCNSYCTVPAVIFLLLLVVFHLSSSFLLLLVVFHLSSSFLLLLVVFHLSSSFLLLLVFQLSSSCCCWWCFTCRLASCCCRCFTCRLLAVVVSAVVFLL